jgi:single-strand DNA-binding protein
MSVNVVVVRGRCSRPAELRVLGSGEALASLQVTTRSEQEGTTSVPVSVWSPPAWVERLDVGDEVVVLGRVRRRFFRGADGATGSRVEVEARSVAVARDRRALAALARRARAALDEL